jgi:hypothetical protein
MIDFSFEKRKNFPFNPIYGLYNNCKRLQIVDATEDGGISPKHARPF